MDNELLFEKKITEIDLAFAKEYLKVDYEDEDMFLTTVVAAAKGYIQTILGFRITEEWPNKEDIPTELTIACCLLMSHWFDQRQPQTVGTLGKEMDFAISAIVEAHKIPLKDYDETVVTEYQDILVNFGVEG